MQFKYELLHLLLVSALYATMLANFYVGCRYIDIYGGLAKQEFR